MRTVTRVFSLILIAGMLLVSTGCYLERDHDRYGRRDDRNIRGDRDDHREYNNRGERDGREDRNRRENRDDRR